MVNLYSRYPGTNKIPALSFNCGLCNTISFSRFVGSLTSVGGNKHMVNGDCLRVLREGKNFTYCFFFQAEDGIRDLTVTGVQTCALPISGEKLPTLSTPRRRTEFFPGTSVSAALQLAAPLTVWNSAPFKLTSTRSSVALSLAVDRKSVV